MRKLVLILTFFSSFACFGQSINEAYGSGCGIVGEDPILRIKTEELISTEDVITFTSWVSSDSLLLNVYGCEGLKRLEATGLKLSEFQIEKTNKILNSRKKITVCSGCSFWKESIKKALENNLNQ